MSEELTKRIEQYLKIDSDYAIIINGDYGVGKTYYIKNSLFPKVRKVEVPIKENQEDDNEEPETYTPILISLFGTSAIEEIQNKIFLELNPVLKNKTTKILSAIGKQVLSSLGGEPDELIKDFGTTANKLVDYNKILLCIDDIDRKSPDLNLKEVFGFINDLVENLNAKVILIANEDELRKENDDANENSFYAMLREKVIGVSIHFKNNVESIFEQITKTKYKEQNPNFFKFLQSSKSIIIHKITINNSNLRNLIFFLEHFKIIFEKSNGILNGLDISDKLSSKIKSNILKFSLPIAIEYKMGHLNKSNYEDIKKIYKGSFFDIQNLVLNKNRNNQPEEDLEKTYVDKFKDKYINDDQTNVYFYESIYNYLLGFEYFNSNKLEKEISNSIGIKEDSEPDQYELLRELNYWGCLNLKDSEYRSTTARLLEYVEQGAFTLEQYPSIFRFIVRFENPLNYNVPKLVRRFKKGIKKGLSTYKYIGNLGFKLSLNQDEEYSTEIKEIIEYCVKLNKEIQNKERELNIKRWYSLLKDGKMKSFFEEMNDSQSNLRYKPIFAKLNAKDFLRLMRRQERTEIINLAFELKGRYRKQIFKDLFPEKQFLEDLKTAIEQYLSSTNRTKLDKATYSFLLETVIQSIENFPNDD